MMESITETSAVKPKSKLMKSFKIFNRNSKEITRSLSSSSSIDDSPLHHRSSSLTISEADGDDDLLVDKFGFIIDAPSETESESLLGVTESINEEKSSVKELASLFQFRRSSIIKDKSLRASHVEAKDRGWPSMLGLDTIIAKKAGLYDDLVAMSQYDQDGGSDVLREECKTVWDGIERDLKRTFPKHRLFRESQVDLDESQENLTDGDEGMGEEVYGKQALRRVLRAYSVYDKEIGYCQGMNFIAGMLLMFLTEEEAFWLLVVVMNDEPFKLREVFSKDMTGTHEILYIADKLVNAFLPDLHEHFEDEQVHTSMFTTQWLMTIYTSTFPFELVSKVWDSFLTEGWKIVYKTLIALLKHAQDNGDLLNKDMENILTYLRGFQSKIDADEILSLASSVPLKQKHIRRYASEFRKLMECGEISVREIYQRSDSVSVTSSINLGNIGKVHRFVIKLKHVKRDISVQDLSPKLVPVVGSAKFAVLLNNALSPEECAGLLKRSKGEEFQEVVLEQNKEMILRFNRSIVDDMELADVLYDRVVGALEDIPELWERFSEASWTKQTSNVPVKATRLNNKIHFLKYGYGDYAVPLRDGSFSCGDEKSYVTMMVYLNDEFKGGLTSFKGKKKHFDVKAKPGSILLFDQELRHEECEVVKGRRHILRSEVMYAPHSSNYEYESSL